MSDLAKWTKQRIILNEQTQKNNNNKNNTWWCGHEWQHHHYWWSEWDCQKEPSLGWPPHYVCCLPEWSYAQLSLLSFPQWVLCTITINIKITTITREREKKKKNKPSLSFLGKNKQTSGIGLGGDKNFCFIYLSVNQLSCLNSLAFYFCSCVLCFFPHCCSCLFALCLHFGSSSLGLPLLSLDTDFKTEKRKDKYVWIRELVRAASAEVLAWMLADWVLINSVSSFRVMVSWVVTWTIINQSSERERSKRRERREKRRERKKSSVQSLWFPRFDLSQTVEWQQHVQQWCFWFGFLGGQLLPKSRFHILPSSGWSPTIHFFSLYYYVKLYGVSHTSVCSIHWA